MKKDTWQLLGLYAVLWLFAGIGVVLDNWTLVGVMLGFIVINSVTLFSWFRRGYHKW